MTATFSDEPPRETARMIAYLLGIDYALSEKQHIVFESDRAAANEK